MLLQFRVLLAGLLLLGLAAPAFADNKLAFVVGINAYPNLAADKQLERAVPDATAVGNALHGLGFVVTSVTADATRDAIEDRFDTFTKSIQPGDTVVLYFAGHGISLSDGNYLIPSDIPALGPNDERKAERKAIAEREFGDAIRASGARIAVMVIDACRDNPFPQRGTRSLGASTRGFNRMTPSEGMFVLYSAREGQSALDRLPGGDADPNSVFTRVFLKELQTSGVNLSELGNRVRDEVAELARSGGYDQVPAVYDDLLGSGSVFLGGAARAAPVPTPPGLASDALEWSLIERTTDAGLIADFIHRFPDSPLRGKAEVRLAALKAPQVAPVTAAPPAVVSGPCDGVTLASFGTRRAAPLSGDEECALAPRAEFRECVNCPSMVVVPQGSFTMGSPASEVGRYDEEGPRHDVTLARFAVGKFQVTVAEFKAFVEATGYDAGSQCWKWNGTKFKEVAGSWRSPGYAQTGSHPAACLNWNDAKAYAAWLSKTTGRDYRLLSESEWEYAARGRTSPGDYPRYFFGDDEAEMCRYGNGADRTAQAKVPGAKGWTIVPCSDGYAYTSPVGSFAANAFGLYDMAGNVWQWTQDCYHKNYNDAPSDGSAVTTGDCSRRVLRGGSWGSNPRNLRAAYRIGDDPEDRVINAGFRVARTLPL